MKGVMKMQIDKAMKNIVFIVLMAAGLLSCSKEEWFENLQPEINFFAVPEDATGEEAELRRDFFETTGVYLLFNDTLGVRETPTLSGETASDLQIINFFWNMNPGDSYQDSLSFVYYQEEAQKEAAAAFLQDEILSNLPELFYPYSILLLDRCIHFTNAYGSYDPIVDISTFPALQSTAVALGDIAHLSASEQKSLRSEVSGKLVTSRIDLIPDEEFTVFYSYSEGYYNLYTWELPSPYELAGFLDTYYYAWGVTFNSHEYDKLAFAEKVFELTEEEFRETYSAYPLVIAKMEEMVKILNQYGVNVYQ